MKYLKLSRKSPLLSSAALLTGAFALITACSSDKDSDPAQGAVPNFPANADTNNGSTTEQPANTETSNGDTTTGTQDNTGAMDTVSEDQTNLTLDETQDDTANGNTGDATETDTTETEVDATETDPVVPEERLLVPPSAGTPNLFTDVLGVTEREVDEKLILAVDRIFGVGTGESATPIVNEGFRLYYELPQDPSMAFIWAPDSQDIRSEGMSYGMMIALQMDRQTEFDKLWKFAQNFMQYNDNGDPWQYYLSWRGAVNTGNANNWGINYNAADGPAPDGEEYFAVALYLANRRWGSNGGTNYLQDARNLSAAMLNNQPGGGRTPVIDQGSNMVVFYPSGNLANFSDPSYHLPAFYEIFAQDGPGGDSNRWLQMAEISRQYFVDSADNNTGLHPDYANFNGAATQGQDTHDQFRYDAWRVVMNMGVDFGWGNVDARLTQQVDKYYDFFSTRLNGANVENALFQLNGNGAAGGGSTALTAALAAGGLATNHPNRQQFIDNAWNVGQQSGEFRYYQQLVYILGMLSTGGMYGYEWQ